MAMHYFKTCLVALALCMVCSLFYMKRVEVVVLFYFDSDITQEDAKTGYKLTDNDLLKQAVYFDRQDHLEKTCGTYWQRRKLDGARIPLYNIFNNSEVIEHLLVDEKHKLLYCYVPKVACTNWKRTLLYLSGRTNAKDPAAIHSDLVHRSGVFPKLTDFSKEKALHILRTYTKFLIVRHPLERILSAYHNKFEQKYDSSKYFQKRFGRHIVKKYRKNPSNHSLEHGDDVTFPEFATYLTTEVASQGKYNEHWKPMHELCAPCLVRYDIIARYETLEDDAAFLLRSIGESPKTFNFHQSPTASKLKKYVSMLPVKTINKLFKMYEEDFQLFDYDLRDFIGFDVE